MLKNELEIKYRIIANLVILASVFIAPWWLTIILITAGVFLFRFFYEAFIFSVLLDGFHGVQGVTFWGLNSLFLTIVGIIFIASIFLKTRLRFY